MDPKIELPDFTHTQPPFSLPIESAPSGGQLSWKERSDVAYLAGFLGIASIFWRFSVAPLIWQHQHGMFDLNPKGDAIAALLFLLAIPLPGIPAPFALLFGVRGWSDLKQDPNKTGVAQVVFAMLIGVVGTLILFSEIIQVVYYLIYS
jgi:hypothetical protein